MARTTSLPSDAPVLGPGRALTSADVATVTVASTPRTVPSATTVTVTQRPTAPPSTPARTTSTPAATAPPATPPTATPPPAKTPAPVVHTVRLAAVAADNASARLTVDGEKFRVLPGADFASGYTLLSLRDGRCGTVRAGGRPFDLCEGQHHVVP